MVCLGGSRRCSLGGFQRGLTGPAPSQSSALPRACGRQSQNAREIAERAGWLYDKFVLFIQDLDEVGNRLQQLDKAYAAARNKLTDGRGNLVSRSEQLKWLGARASKSLPPDLLERAMTDVNGVAHPAE